MGRPCGPAAPVVTQARVGRKVYLQYYAVPVAWVPDAGVTARMARYFSLRNLAGTLAVDTERSLVNGTRTNRPSAKR